MYFLLDNKSKHIIQDNIKNIFFAVTDDINNAVVVVISNYYKHDTSHWKTSFRINGLSNQFVDLW